MEKEESATFGLGCFWCSEAIFKQLRGVTKVESGYSGGTVPNPTYEQVSGGSTGHAEAIQVMYDPSVISYKDLLYVFWRLHDPTTLNRQGNDVGTQYRSVIFYHNEKQKEEAIASKNEVEEAKMYRDSIVTQILPFTNFYPAEPYHQDYYKRKQDEPYCRLVINPKIEKLKEEFKEYLIT